MTYVPSQTGSRAAVLCVRSLLIALAAFRYPMRIPALIARCHRRVLDREHLAGLSDHVLADMGLTRRDVDRELAQPWWRPLFPSFTRH